MLDAHERRRYRQSIQSSITRRWVLTGLGAAMLLAGDFLDIAPLTWQAAVGFLSAAISVSLAAAGVIRARQSNQWWLLGLALADAALASSVVVILGNGGSAVLVVLAVLPYSWDEPGWISESYGIMGAAMYFSGVVVHGLVFARPPFGIDSVPAIVWLETGLVAATVSIMRRAPAALLARIRIAADLMQQARDGMLSVRAPAQRADELGFMEDSFNRMLENMAQTIFAVQREADEVAVLAEVLSQSAQGVLGSSESVAAVANELAKAMATQRAQAENGYRSSNEAAGEAGGLLDRAQNVASGARGLLESAAIGRERVHRAGEALLSIGEEVRTTAASVEVLSGMSERVGKFVHSVSRIARQTHVLALNAAIEAAHSAGDREGFSAVAEEVRLLAAEAATSARDVAELIDEVQSRIDAVARAMSSGQEKVQDVGGVAVEARTALEELYTGATRITELVEATADISKSQSERMGTLAGKMSQIAELSARSSDEATSAAASMVTQKSTIQDLTAISTQLADVADRVRQSVARFTVLKPGQANREFSVPRGDSFG